METATPLVLAGPILRRLQAKRLTLWLATSQPVAIRLRLLPQGESPRLLDEEALASATTTIQAGQQLYLQLIDLPLSQPLPLRTFIGYELALLPRGQPQWLDWQQWGADLALPGYATPGFVLQPGLTRLLHGSCRKPHHPSADGLLRGEQWLATQPPEQWPSLLMLSGDQVYMDDVAGPMLVAIHQLIKRLGCYNEKLPEGLSSQQVADSEALYQQPFYYQREALLPDDPASEQVARKLFAGARKPIFTSDNAHNHLMTLAEMLAMYLLVWSPAPWALVAPEAMPSGLTPSQQQRYQQEQQALDAFQAGLTRVRRLMAHLPCAMIFDDHDVTDDWNLTAAWEQTAYGHPFSKRIIGNALLAYLLCQGWGNAPQHFPLELMERVRQACAEPGGEAHQQVLDQLLRFHHWHYQWETNPPLLVLDTRTHRWRSERSLQAPSGLMDWEALTDLQQQLLGLEAVVLVSPAPVFGVKLIESVQRLFTWVGKPLMVDAENWMAHSGAAYALMNLFWHPRTPRHFVILSGDVHYSFVYDVELRGHDRGPDIWQITSSGIKNEFPPRLLRVFDRLNRWLYSPRSPLNWLTKRRRMRVMPRRPQGAELGTRLVNQAGLGLLELDAEGRPRRVVQLTSAGADIHFQLEEGEARWE